MLICLIEGRKTPSLSLSLFFFRGGEHPLRPPLDPPLNPVISREWGKDREVFTASGTYLWSFVTQIFHNGQPSHGGDRKIFEVMTSTLPKGTLGSVASLLAATLYQEHPDRNHKLWNIVSSERYILHMQVLLECCYNATKFTMGKLKLSLLS